MFRIGLVIAIFFLSLSGLYFMAKWTVDNDHQLFFPSNLEELRDLLRILNEVDVHKVLPLFCAAYLFKQTFAIPGSTLLNVLAGSLFGTTTGFLLSCLLTATGATFCYLLARLIGRDAMEKYFAKFVSGIHNRLEENKMSLPYYLMFLRLFPGSPNWAINLCCGLVGVPLWLFFSTVFIGLMPYNYICVQTGALLSSIKTLSDIFTWSTVFQLSGLAIVSLLPTLFVKKQKDVKVCIY